jgi:hypothetical protein
MADVEKKPQITARPRASRGMIAYDYPRDPELPYEHLDWYDMGETPRELDFSDTVAMFRVMGRMR